MYNWLVSIIINHKYTNCRKWLYNYALVSLRGWYECIIVELFNIFILLLWLYQSVNNAFFFSLQLRSVLSSMQLLLHIIDMLEDSNVHCYVDSTVDTVNSARQVFLGKTSTSAEKYLCLLSSHLSGIFLYGVKGTWFNSTPKRHKRFDTSLPWQSLIAAPTISILGLSVSSDCHYCNHQESKPKLASKKLGLSAERDSALRQKNGLYRAQVRPRTSNDLWKAWHFDFA